MTLISSSSHAGLGGPPLSTQEDKENVKQGNQSPQSSPGSPG